MAVGDFVIALAAVVTAYKFGRKGLEELRTSTKQPLQQLDRAPDGKMRASFHDVKNLDDRIAFIRQMIDKGVRSPEVREYATRVVSQRCGDKWCIPEKDYDGEIEAIFNAYRKHVRYVRDPLGADLYQHPRVTLKLHAGDCDCAAIALGSFLQAIGYPIQLRVIRTKDSPDWNHIYLLVGIPPGSPSKWVALDATVDHAAGWEAPAGMVAARKDYPV